MDAMARLLNDELERVFLDVWEGPEGQEPSSLLSRAGQRWIG